MTMAMLILSFVCARLYKHIAINRDFIPFSNNVADHNVLIDCRTDCCVLVIGDSAKKKTFRFDETVCITTI